MAAQKLTKEVVGWFFFAFLNAFKPKNQLIKAFNSIGSSRSYGRLSQNEKNK